MSLVQKVLAKTNLDKIEWYQFSKGFYFHFENSDVTLYLINKSKIPFFPKYALCIYDSNGDHHVLEYIPKVGTDFFLHCVRLNMASRNDRFILKKSEAIYQELERR